MSAYVVKIAKWFPSSSTISCFFIPLGFCCCHNCNLYCFTPFLSKTVDLGKIYFCLFGPMWCDVGFYRYYMCRQIFVLIPILVISSRLNIIHLSIHMKLHIKRWLSQLYLRYNKSLRDYRVNWRRGKQRLIILIQ